MKKLIGLIGYPLGHSVSPAMHNAAFKALNIDYEYVPFEVDQYDLSQSVVGMRALHIAGFNVTVPHKEAIVPLLDDVTKLAQVIGAVNTVQNQEGTLIGYNTDGPGFLESLREDAEFDPLGKEVVVLGAGGASRAVSIMLTETKVKSLVIADLDEDKARELAAQAGSFSKVPCRHARIDSVELNRAIASADLLVNTTPVGMAPKISFSPLPADALLNAKTLVYDLVYNPAETALIKQAKKRGCKTCSGLGMLVRQGGLAFSIFTGEEPPLDVMWQAARNGLKN
ncbi:shikimate dehydrogenase [candidate division WOR-1 bacterium RIFOXYA12_FULL_52_29]|uniref:Shikimate dehydrogenase (NADP(+)) n=1 Tax=candidate division WOR-1 bacterium RIFOXYC12_FULL_54_18 TaxID=1802584 RepID=A0A1F4T7E3_UNCSA|nr:MAG: shikimate dehydrogenase [candidate division WOR-1 bacterium RIFOXYA2_FULL_51_19]OGC18060.1 MAG: shikimate dehydrogenase [candidate division WOR-1 bacterium RIFOXYA12_FULL_52_29]OGC26916.1 MAG: shikimate dehydrogenase [candidate division WOR-1 bacterium RIFOXYB2_FULL_45_9]OGC28477.1 MAG: shikimate dehydrogenase [candidate division WOR-1 bacterium RIFOXYC12_FULL_54_18]OGC31068.1 MAG: shikimate dehydrogenase [candidate division WOR-1 bacterium RIFOXYB12_FULL_52_16]